MAQATQAQGSKGPDGVDEGTEGTTEATGGQGAAENTPDGDKATEGKGEPAGGVEALRKDLADERKARQAAQQQAEQFQNSLAQMLRTLTGEKGEDGAELTPQGIMAELQRLRDEQAEKEKAGTQKMIRTEVRAAATAKGFHDPTDALARVNLDEVPVSEDGEIDTEWIQQRLDKVATDSPYLVKSGTVEDVAAEKVGIGAAGKATEPAAGVSRIAAGYKTSGKTKR